MDDVTALPLTATHWGAYRVRSENGRATEMIGFEQDPDPSPIGPGVLDVQDGPTRITQPMIRESWLDGGPGAATEKRGSDAFVAVSWEEAERLVADELDRVRRAHGNRAIYAGSYGWASAGRFHHAQSQLKRFLNCIGGFTSSRFTYSFAAAEAMVPHILGDFREFLNSSTSWESIAGNTDLFVAFGGVPVKNGQIDSGGVGAHVQREGLERAKAAGVDFVNIGPLRSDMLDEMNAEWLAPRPNTDTAILLALAHTLVVEDRHDAAFLARYTHGFERFRAYLVGETDGTPKGADWAGAISGLEPETIRALARRMAASRTMISVAWSLTRQDHGEQPFWAAIALAAMLGQIGLPGGGFGFGYSACNSIGGQYALMRAASLPQGRNPVADFIPVARISDLLLNPGAEFDFDGMRLTYPDIRLVWWAGGNPFHHHQDLNRLRRAWARPETVIVNDWCWNAAARHADIVLPCTTPLEREDVFFSLRDPYAIAMRKVSTPPGAVRNEYETFRALAGRLGVEEAFTDGRDEESWLRWIYDATRQQTPDLPDFGTFREEGWRRVDPPEEPIVMLRAFREDPEGAALKTPSGKIEIFSETVAGFGYEDCPGHPAWFEPKEWLGNATVDFPLHLVSNQPPDKLHSQLDHGARSRAGKIGGREPVGLHPEDAAARGIGPGDVVRVFNARGACLGAAVIDDGLRRGVARMSTGAWYDPDETGMCKHGNPNVLTRDQGTSSLGQGPVAHSCLVQIERFDGTPPPVTAFVPPEVRSRET